MGGYGAFVWPAYGLAAVALALLVWQSLTARRAERRRVAALEAAPPPPAVASNVRSSHP